MALEWVLHARYMTPSVNRGTNNYGGQEFGSDCLQDDRKEAPFTSVTADASRNTFNYFSSSSNIYLDSGIGGTIEIGNGNKQAVNRAANFMGKDYLLIGDTIYSYVDASGTWVTEQTLTGKTAASTSSLGLYPVYIGNAPHLVTAWSVSNGATWRFAKLNGDTGTWTVSAAIAGGLTINDTNGGVLTEIQHGSRIYYTTSSEVSFGYYDFVLDSFGTNSFGTTSRHPMDFASYMGNLYILNKNATDNVQVLKVEDSSTTFQNLIFDTGTPSAIGGIDVGDTLTTTSQFEGRPLFFIDHIYDSGNAPGETAEPTLWAYYVTHASSAGHLGNGIPSAIDTNHGLIAQPLRIINGTLQGVAAPVSQPITGFRTNPFKMMHNQEGTFLIGLGNNSRKDEDMVLRVFTDQKDRGISGDGRSSIVCASRFAGQGGCTEAPGGGGDFGNLMYHVFKGSGNTDGGNHPNPPTKDGGAHAFDFIGFPAKQTRHRALPHGQLGGGARHSEFDGGFRIADIVFRGVDTTSQGGIIRISYSIIPSTGNPIGDSVNVRWWHDINSHSPESSCTLVGTSDGAISGLLAANVVVDPDKTYYVDWDARGDGLVRYQRYTLNGQINLGQEGIVAIDDPTDLSQLLSWFEADDESTITSGIAGGVSQWRDKATGLSGLVQFNSSFQPTYVLEANNTLGGVSFANANSEFLFSSGSPITGQASTIFVIYEPAQLNFMTFFSLSNDNVSQNFNLKNYEYWNMNTDAGDSSLGLVDQSFGRQASGIAARELVVPSGGIADNTRLAVWRNTPFEGRGQLFPSGELQDTEFTVDGSVECSGLSNTTFGRFSGAQISGVYSPFSYYDGVIYEIVVYDRILADVEVERFEKYAKAKYNLDD